MLPTLFIGHGNPMNAILENNFTKSLKKLWEKLVIPKAILIISSHRTTNWTYITFADKPEQIYDFYWFDKELYDIKYQPNWSKEFALKIKNTVKSTDIKLTNQWWLDHAWWTILKHIYPNANIPVITMSIDIFKDINFHYNLWKELSKLRNEWLLIIWSWDIIHNLNIIDFENLEKWFDWAINFDNKISEMIIKKYFKWILEFNKLWEIANLSVPTIEHFLPLIYIIWSYQEKDKIEFIYKWIQNWSISMTSVKFW